ncbi:MAG: dTDP-4-dehydrorhamnose 3,5-epimerase family protein [Candidatus Omnitrophota bacterium]
MIEGVKVKKLKVIPDDRGRLMEILRCDDEIFEKFGQVYMTTAFPGVVKAWHYHKKQDDNFACVHGKIKVALYDSRQGSKTYGEVNEFELSLENPIVVHIPKLVYHGFKTVGSEEAIVVNTITFPYDAKNPDEHRVDAFENNIDYDWKSA